MFMGGRRREGNGEGRPGLTETFTEELWYGGRVKGEAGRVRKGQWG